MACRPHPCVWWKVPWISKRRRSTRPFGRSSAPSARARSCGSATARSRVEIEIDLDRARSGSTSRSASAGCRAAASSRSTGRKRSGKTTLALHVIAEAQKTGGICAFVDAEHALDPTYARKLGVNIDELLISQPDAGEQALEIADTLVRSGAVDVLVVDSVAALVPRPRSKARWATATSGLQARLMSQALRKLTGSISALADAW